MSAIPSDLPVKRRRSLICAELARHRELVRARLQQPGEVAARRGFSRRLALRLVNLANGWLQRRLLHAHTRELEPAEVAAAAAVEAAAAAQVAEEAASAEASAGR
jgi:hypothetical protein